MTWAVLGGAASPTWTLNVEGPLLVLQQQEVDAPILLQSGEAVMIQEERWSTVLLALNPGWL